MFFFARKEAFGLKPGSRLRLASGRTAVIEEKIGEGGQGAVYKAVLDSSLCALKLYHPKALKDPERFFDNLSLIIKDGAPSARFLWPADIVFRMKERVGYVMGLKPEAYESFSRFLCARVRFASLDAVVNAALCITNAFRDLHRKGYSYQDINDGNFFIHPESGDVLICDNDNVAPNGVALGIAGKVRYMAPEVARHIRLPDNHSDRFSLAVILFELLFLSHPLEGRKTLVPCMTEKLELELYAKKPVFIYDPEDDSNRPDVHVHSNVVRLWPIFPRFLRDMFLKAFSKPALNADDIPSLCASRLMDSQWQTAFVNLRSCVVSCVCGQRTIIDLDAPFSHCFGCGARIAKPMVMEVGKYRLPLFPSVKVYDCHTSGQSDDHVRVRGEVVRHPEKPSLWGLKNLDERTWRVVRRDGTETDLPPGRSIRIGDISQVRFDSFAKGVVVS